MTKAQPDARALRRPRAELVGPTTIAAMYGAAVYFDRRASRAYLHLRRRFFASLVDVIEVDDVQIRIKAKSVLQEAVLVKDRAPNHVCKDARPRTSLAVSNGVCAFRQRVDRHPFRQIPRVRLADRRGGRIAEQRGS